MVDEKLNELLKKSHLFKRVREDDVMRLAEQCDKVIIEKDNVLYYQGSRANFFYMIGAGKISHTYQNKDSIQTLGVLVEGDYLGLDALFNSGRRVGTAKAMEYTELYRLRIDSLKEITAHFPRFNSGIQMMEKSYKAAWNTPFPWLEKDEILYFVARKHPAFLLVKQILPIIIGLFALILFGMGGMSGLSTFILAGVGATIVSLGWAVWSYIDWWNDYYIVTNQRVIWLEKVVALYDSRHETPLQTIRSVDFHTTFLARLLGYGNVVINTFTDRIVLSDIGFPQQVVDVIEEHLGRVTRKETSTKLEGMRRTLRTRVGIDKPDVTPKPTFAVRSPQKRIKWSASIRMRQVGGDVITYHKHWIVLLTKLMGPVMVLLASVVLVIGRVFEFSFFTLFTLPTILLLAFMMLLIGGVWLWYQHADWMNDIYRVTAEQIIDIERKPLGDEQKKTAPLDSILSLQVERLGIFGILFNFGSVVAEVSGTRFIFKDIHDPVTAQLDISTRMDAYRKKKKLEDEARGDQRLMDWLKILYEETTRSQKINDD